MPTYKNRRIVVNMPFGMLFSGVCITGTICHERLLHYHTMQSLHSLLPLIACCCTTVFSKVHQPWNMLLYVWNAYVECYWKPLRFWRQREHLYGTELPIQALHPCHEKQEPQIWISSGCSTHQGVDPVNHVLGGYERYAPSSLPDINEECVFTPEVTHRVVTCFEKLQVILTAESVEIFCLSFLYLGRNTTQTFCTRSTSTTQWIGIWDQKSHLV